MTLAQIHARSFQSRIRWRNGREYIAAVVVVALFGWRAVFDPDPLMRLGWALGVVGTLFVVWQLYRRGSARAVPSGPAAASLAFHRAELVRQHDALRRVWLWYLAPLVPSLAIIYIARARAHPEALGKIAVGLAVSVAVFLAIFLLNRWGARRLQRQIEEIDSLGPDA